MITFGLTFNIATAQSAGDLDLTFGINGSAITDLGNGYDQCSGLVIQPDQKIVVGGRAQVNGGFYPTLIRMNPDGSIDNTFGEDGITSGDVPHSTTFYAEADALAIQPDGKLLYAFHLGAWGGDGLAVTRFNDDGSIDTSFGINGTASTIPFDNSNYSNSLLLQSDGKIVLVGRGQWYDGGPGHVSAVRFNSNGILDETFAVAGFFSLNLGGTNDQALDVKQQIDGKIVMTGIKSNSGFYEYLVIRLNENGSFDESFSDDGIFSVGISGSYDNPKFIAIRNDGSILITGIAYTENMSDFGMVLMCLTPAGEVNTSFGNNGITTYSFGVDDDFAESVAVDNEGRILVAGHVEDFYIYGAVLRFDENGILDSSFGDNGISVIDAYSYHVENIKLQSDGKIVVCGWTGYSDTNEHHFTASRILSEDVNSVSDLSVDASSFTLYPNPTQGQIYLKFDESHSMEVSSYVLLDCFGRTISSNPIKANADKFLIETSELAEGVYTVQLNGTHSFYCKQFVVVR